MPHRPITYSFFISNLCNSIHIKYNNHKSRSYLCEISLVGFFEFEYTPMIYLDGPLLQPSLKEFWTGDMNSSRKYLWRSHGRNHRPRLWWKNCHKSVAENLGLSWCQLYHHLWHHGVMTPPGTTSLPPATKLTFDALVFSGLMMTSSNGNIFRVTCHLCGEFTGHRWIPRTKASDAELWCFLWSASE